MALTFWLTVAYAGGVESAGTVSAAAATAAMAAVIAGAYALNDARDRAVDQRNAPRRPVAAGRVSPVAAAAGGLLLMAGGLAGAAVWARWAFAASLAGLAGALVVYDLTSKRLGPLKQAAVAALMTAIYPLALAQAGRLAGPRAASLAAFPVWMFLTAWGYELLKDIRDASGDLRAAPDDSGAARFAATLLRDASRWRTIAGAAILVGAAALAPPAWLGCGWLYAAMLPLPLAAAGGAAWTACRNERGALVWVYVECVGVGLAATADLLLRS
ncbi:MAG: prenyltransferase [Planctomycetes bacterium ADurb.Bin126]|nr:MAG: prenyltransferase [Planctomycetes bacterium ADurb.Bin126]HOD80167.1 UbiA family prenyltransferase [Phycisphaerae bacterium]HQL71639.1 UbiA family prenyltransferase [Phycisphaerae bacterium]